MTELLARVVFAREALQDGDTGLVAAILCDIEEEVAGQDPDEKPDETSPDRTYRTAGFQ